MPDLSPLTTAGASGIALALIMLVYWLMNGAAKERTEQREMMAEALGKLGVLIDSNTKVTQETYTYLKIRNGRSDHFIDEMNGKFEKLEKAIKRSIKEKK